MDAMPAIPRRVVTGHDERGVSIFAVDGPVPVVRTAPDGALFCEIWSTGAMPAPIAAAEPDPIVLDGEVVLVLDDSETVLRAGDVVVQRGTSHRWENRSGQTARMAFILVDGCFTVELLDSLGGDVLGGLLHDPMKGEA
jgi:hypothetical protein